MSVEKEIFDNIDEELVLEDARRVYSPRVIQHFLTPQNVGEAENPVGYTFLSGICGDTIGISVGLANGTIERISFVTNGCGPTIACSSALTCMAKGRLLEDAMKITSDELIVYLGGLPRENTHCADLAVNTLKEALAKAG
jgi:uncharacterized protein (DUF4213/DUF364 family)/NifU-like protein involved in Fe-S cluster formation